MFTFPVKKLYLLSMLIFSVLLGNQVTGSLTLEVSKNISPLETLDVFLKLKYKNARGDDKLNTTHKLSHAFVAGVPSFFLKLNASTNRIRIGGRAKFWFDILLRKMVSTLKVEVCGKIKSQYQIMP